MHEIVATQLWEGDPSEVWDTALRLRDAGYERHEIFHMLGRPVTDQIWAAWHELNRMTERVTSRGCERFPPVGSESGPPRQHPRDTMTRGSKHAGMCELHAAATGARNRKAPLSEAF